MGLTDPSPPGRRVDHVVWDWNGTLLDDFELTARIGGASFEALGVPDVTPERFRRAFTRPYSAFYSRLLGRAVTDEEFEFIRGRYEAAYTAAVERVALQPDAHVALDHAGARASMSILSMAPHAELQQLIDRHGLRSRFVLVEGSHTGSSDGTKVASLCRHLDELGVDPGATVYIGDTIDDFEAATTCGAEVVLVTTGSQARGDLESTGAPVVDSLLEAARIATADVRDRGRQGLERGRFAPR